MIYLFLLIIGVLLLLFVFYQYFKGLLFISIVIILSAIAFNIFVRKFQHYERAIIFAFGRFSRVAGPGWSIVIPFIEDVREVYDIRTTNMKLLVPLSLTKEEIRLRLVATIYYRISEPKHAYLEIKNYKYNLKEIAEAEVRNFISKISFNYIIANIDHINELFLDRLRHITLKFGVDIELFELDQIEPPKELVEAMQRVEIEEEKYQAQKFRALAEKVVIEALGEAATKLDKRAISYLYVKAIEGIEQDKAAKIVFPMEFMKILDDVGSNALSKIDLKGVDIGKAVDMVKKTILSQGANE